jgi:hypothetical protein
MFSFKALLYNKAFSEREVRIWKMLLMARYIYEENTVEENNGYVVFLVKEVSRSAEK